MRDLVVNEPAGLFGGFDAGEKTPVWMSHGDHVDVPPPGFRVTASSGSVAIAAMRHESKPVHAVQFHPEVAHTARGADIISNFVFDVCGAHPSWTPGTFIDEEDCGSASESVTRASSAGSLAVWIPRSQPRWYIARSEIS